MDRVEYRLDWVDLHGEGPRLEKVVERVNELAAEGWRVVSVDLTPHPAFELGPLPILLERPLAAQAVASSRASAATAAA